MIFTNRNLGLKFSVIIALFSYSCKVTHEAQIKCCGINQEIPVFKADKNFQNDYYPDLTAKNILKPIQQSDAPLEIRYTVLAQYVRTIVIRCHANTVQVLYYGVGRVPKTLVGDYLTDGVKDIGAANPNVLYTALLKFTDLTDRYKTYDWNNLFAKLTKYHFFDLPGEPAFQDSIKKIRPGSYYPNGTSEFLEVKIGNQFRNVLHLDSNSFPGITGVNLLEDETNIQKLLQIFFPKTNPLSQNQKP